MTLGQSTALIVGIILAGIILIVININSNKPKQVTGNEPVKQQPQEFMLSQIISEINDTANN